MATVNNKQGVGQATIGRTEQAQPEDALRDRLRSPAFSQQDKAVASHLMAQLKAGAFADKPTQQAQAKELLAAYNQAVSGDPQQALDGDRIKSIMAEMQRLGGRGQGYEAVMQSGDKMVGAADQLRAGQLSPEEIPQPKKIDFQQASAVELSAEAQKRDEFVDRVMRNVADKLNALEGWTATVQGAEPGKPDAVVGILPNEYDSPNSPVEIGEIFNTIKVNSPNIKDWNESVVFSNEAAKIYGMMGPGGGYFTDSPPGYEALQGDQPLFRMAYVSPRTAQLTGGASPLGYPAQEFVSLTTDQLMARESELVDAIVKQFVSQDEYSGSIKKKD